MDRITRTSQDALVNYYNSLRRLGNVSRQDKYRLLVLWFYNYLKNGSDFLMRWDEDEKRFKVDRELEHKVEAAFRNNISCLADSSCFIKIHSDDNCVPVPDTEWGKTDSYRFIVTNATPLEVSGSYPTGDIGQILEMLCGLYENTDFMTPNDDEETLMTQNNDNNQ